MCGCNEASSNDSGPSAPGTRAVVGTVAPVIRPAVPLADRLIIQEQGAELPQSLDPVISPQPSPIPGAAPFKSCRPGLRDGAYALTFQPSGSLSSFQGTLRVDRSAPDGGPDNIIVSGDLYRKPLLVTAGPAPAPGSQPDPIEPAPASSPSIAASASTPSADAPSARLRIPIYPRNHYHSYLKVTSVSAPVVVPIGTQCTVTLRVEQYDYTHPAPGSFKGSFPAAASRLVSITLKPVPAPLPFPGPNFAGRWVEGGVDKGVVTLAWVSSFFRRASVEIDTLAGAVAPQPVPDGMGGTEYFDTIYARHGWQLSIVADQTNVPVPPGVTPTNCWASGALHNLMAVNRNPTTNLDTEWRIHLMVVPAKLGCGRGVMFDIGIDVPREGCASFSDDGYPVADSVNFGAAANQKQRDVARAFLRSATHEITHTFNQIHQEQETMPDNSIMTTTPSVANVLGGPATGAPGVFPDQINLAVNTTVRHHLVHMPDPVIRPGGWPFASWFGSTVPQATDRYQFDPSELELTVTGPSTAVVLGQPIELSWTLTNRSGGSLVVPNDVSLEGLFSSITITDVDGAQRPFRPSVIVCDTVTLAELQPGDSVAASHRVFWSSDGFAFSRPGLYRATIAVTWSAHGTPVGVEQEIEVFIEFPTTGADNEAAGLVMNTEVGKWVALGGNAYHLTEATRRLQAISAQTLDAGPRLLTGFDGLLPDPARVRGDEPENPPQ